MAKVLFFPFSNQLGTCIPSITLANILKNAGHEVIFASKGMYTNVISSHGFKVEPINEISYLQYREHINNNDMDFYNRELIRHFVDMEVELIKKINPDVVVQHNRPTLKISSQLTKKKLISLVVACLTDYYGYRYFIPDNHPIARILPWVDINKILPPSLPKIVLKQTAKKWVKEFNWVAQYYNLPLFDSFFDLNVGDLTMLVETYGLVKLKEDLPDSVLFLEQDVKNSFGDTYVWLNEVIKAKKAGKKVIFVSMGTSSFASYPLVLEGIVDLIVKNPDKYVLVSNHCGLETEYKNRKNIFIEKFINPSTILDYVDVVVTHGGKNTLNECLLAKKRVIGVPEQVEQLWNLKYIESLGLAEVISRFKLEKHPLLLVEKIIATLENKKGSTKVNEFVRTYLEKKDIIDHKSTFLQKFEELVNIN